MTDEQNLVIQIIGWIYFAAWSLSFYGQIYENFRRKSVEGMNLDFVAMNLTGFLFYSIYCSYGYFVSTDQTGKVDLNDCIFAYHALLATLVCIGQVLVFPRKNNRLHFITLIYLIGMWLFVIIYGTLTEKTKTIVTTPDTGVISIMGYMKLSISFLKYLPQFYWNYKRKSTEGWSIFNIILDLTGGLFSFGQMGLEAIFGQDIKINVVKLILGIMVVIYDILFIIQHYCIYPKSKSLAVYNKYKQSTIIDHNSLIVPTSDELEVHVEPIHEQTKSEEDVDDEHYQDEKKNQQEEALLEGKETENLPAQNI